MADELSPGMQALAAAIRAHPGPRAALLGFDLWLEVLSSPHIAPREVVPGGTFATGEESDKVVKVPVPVLGRRVVVAYDASLPPDAFVIRPEPG